MTITPGGDTAAAGVGDSRAPRGQDPDPAPRDVRFRPPLQRRGLVRRARLLARLEAVPADVPLIVLSAPAGYGKTTLLSQWAATGSRPFAWVTVDETDSDPAQFAHHVAVALAGAHRLPESATATLAAIRPGGWARVLRQLLRVVHALPGPTVVVLDDLQDLQGRQSLSLIQGLAEALPPGLHLAIAARSRPALGLGRLRAERRCVELGRDELGFSEEETRLALRAAGQYADPHRVRAVVARTEGWPAGVYLTVLVGGHETPGDGAPDAAAVAGDDARIAGYFRDELLARESPDDIRFLMRLSVLQQMSAPLCDAVLDRADSAARLAQAERRNLFVVPLDRSGHWYRYHRLFRQMLLAELRRREPGEEERLHRRAAAWFEREGQPEQAIAHALAGRDQLTAARLVNGRARELIAFGRVRTVQGWLRSLDDDALLAYPPVAVTAGWLWALAGDADRAQNSLRAVRAASFTDPMPDGSRSLESATALLSAMLAPLGVEQMLQDATTAVRLEVPGNPWRPFALTALGIAHVLGGEPERAVKEFGVALLAREGQPLAAALSHAQLALLALQRGDPSADVEASTSLLVVEEAGLREDLVAILTYSVCAWAAARRGDPREAAVQTGAALRLAAVPSPVAFPWLGAHSALALGRAALELHDPVAARLRLEEARQHVGRLPTQGVLRSQVDDLARRLAGDGGRTRLPSAMSLTAGEVRVLQFLPTHLRLQDIADELFVSRSTVKSQVASIHRKLQAATRSQAVQRGRELGLLEA
jgi:LuxR family maltose regulon positive regulatory protein